MRGGRDGSMGDGEVVSTEEDSGLSSSSEEVEGMADSVVDGDGNGDWTVDCWVAGMAGTTGLVDTGWVAGTARVGTGGTVKSDGEDRRMDRSGVAAAASLDCLATADGVTAAASLGRLPTAGRGVAAVPRTTATTREGPPAAATTSPPTTSELRWKSNELKTCVNVMISMTTM
ncbi:unnamed protein product [Cuscuta campestris]|uniref:Uncharacterized protein n=1 Tax=Cuscuta campestris TaxID=132261 RepID=A0A484MBV4_9ASTE|nr:unnamed protein product [Cuscuta campestris]